MATKIGLALGFVFLAMCGNRMQNSVNPSAGVIVFVSHLQTLAMVASASEWEGMAKQMFDARAAFPRLVS